MHPKINFLPCKTNQNKIGCITHTLEKYYHSKKSVLVIVPNKQAEKFLDEALWKYATDSFLPHTVSEDPTNELIVITVKNENLNNSTVLLNLSSEPCSIAEQFEVIYELYDETFPDKLVQSKKRRHHYVEMGYTISDLT